MPGRGSWSRPRAGGARRQPDGRIFTGDRSGDFLFAALHRAGFANQPTSVARDDGLALRGAYVTAVNRCAPPGNRPTPQERDRCLPFLRARDRAARASCACSSRSARSRGTARSGRSARSGYAPDGRKPASATAPRPTGGPYALLGCFHPSQQNTFTGKLTPAMLDAVLARAVDLAR